MQNIMHNYANLHIFYMFSNNHFPCDKHLICRAEPESRGDSETSRKMYLLCVCFLVNPYLQIEFSQKSKNVVPGCCPQMLSENPSTIKIPIKNEYVPFDHKNSVFEEISISSTTF